MNTDYYKTLEQLEKGTNGDRVVYIRSIYKTGKMTVQPTPTGGGWYKGLERLTKVQKDERIFVAEPDARCKLFDGKQFDLNNPDELTTWNWVKHSSCLAATFDECQTSEDAIFYVEMVGEEARKSIDRRTIKFNAMSYVLNDDPINYKTRALLLNVNMNEADILIVKDFLTEKAEESPESIIEVYESSDISYKLLLLKAIDLGQIVKDHQGLFTYGNVVLGMTHESCIAWMKDTANKEAVKLLQSTVSPEKIKRTTKKSSESK